MRIIYFIIPCILILSCGKPPEPLGASPENNPLKIPDEIVQQELKVDGKYQPSSIIFNFFFWPSGLTGEPLSDLSTEVSRIGIGIEQQFETMDENNKYIYDSSEKIKNLKKEKKEKISALYKGYSCIKNETADNCVEDNISTSPTSFPKTCEELGSPPWNKPESIIGECKKEKTKIENNYDEKIDIITKEKNDREKTVDDLLVSMAEGESALCKLLENDPENPNKWVNWMRTEQTDAHIKLDSNDPPQITLEILFNNNLEGVENRKLKYTSTKPKEIRNLRYYLENQIPVLEFTLYEKRVTGPEPEEGTGEEVTGEEGTGVYYQIKLRQAELEFGLNFLGEVERFKEGKSFGKGIMKIYFPRQF